jgi:hypothetical protein
MASRQKKGPSLKSARTQKAILDSVAVATLILDTMILKLVNLWRKSTVNSADQYKSLLYISYLQSLIISGIPKIYIKIKENFIYIIKEVSEVEQWMKHHLWKTTSAISK